MNAASLNTDPTSSDGQITPYPVGLGLKTEVEVFGDAVTQILRQRIGGA